MSAELPVLLVAQLPRHLPPHEAASLRLVCRSWRQAVDLDELRPFSVQCLTLAAPAALLAHVHAIEYRPARFYMGGSCGIISSPFKCPLSQLACFSRLACLEVDAGAKRLHCWPALAALTQLTKLELSGVVFSTRELLPSIASLRCLRSLSLHSHWSAFSAAQLAALAPLAALTSLTITGAGFTGEALQFDAAWAVLAASLTSLAELSLCAASPRARDPPQRGVLTPRGGLNGLSALKALPLRRLCLSPLSELPESLYSLTQLQALQLGGISSLTCASVSRLLALEHLTSLTMLVCLLEAEPQLLSPLAGLAELRELQVEYGSGFSEEEEASQAPPTAQLLGANLQLLERLQGLTHVTLQPASGSLGLDEAECSLTACFTSLESMQRLLCASPGMALAAGGGAAAAAVRPPTDTAGISSSDTGGGGGSSGDNGPEPCPGPKPRRAIMAGIKPAEGAGSSSSSGMCRAAASSSVPRQLASSHCVLSAQAYTRLERLLPADRGAAAHQDGWHSSICALELGGAGARRARMEALVAQQMMQALGSHTLVYSDMLSKLSCISSLTRIDLVTGSACHAKRRNGGRGGAMLYVLAKLPALRILKLAAPSGEAAPTSSSAAASSAGSSGSEASELCSQLAALTQLHCLALACMASVDLPAMQGLVRLQALELRRIASPLASGELTRLAAALPCLRFLRLHHCSIVPLEQLPPPLLEQQLAGGGGGGSGSQGGSLSSLTRALRGLLGAACSDSCGRPKAAAPVTGSPQQQQQLLAAPFAAFRSLRLLSLRGSRLRQYSYPGCTSWLPLLQSLSALHELRFLDISGSNIKADELEECDAYLQQLHYLLLARAQMGCAALSRQHDPPPFVALEAEGGLDEVMRLETGM